VDLESPLQVSGNFEYSRLATRVIIVSSWLERWRKRGYEGQDFRRLLLTQSGQRKVLEIEPLTAFAETSKLGVSVYSGDHDDPRSSRGSHLREETMATCAL
jgi:hypothetical protein